MKVEKPIIGIVSKPRISQHGWNLMYINDHIKDAIISNGGLGIGIVPQGHAIGVGEDKRKYKLSEIEKEDFYSVLGLCDGLILEGD